jgi:hypothetical protein
VKIVASQSGHSSRMLTLVKNWIVPLLLWDAILALEIVVALVVTGRNNLGDEGREFLLWSFVLGLLTVVMSVPICRKVSRVSAALIGLGFGVVIPFAAAWFWGRFVEQQLYGWSHPWGLPHGWNWMGIDAWSSNVLSDSQRHRECASWIFPSEP